MTRTCLEVLVRLYSGWNPISFYRLLPVRYISRVNMDGESASNLPFSVSFASVL